MPYLWSHGIIRIFDRYNEARRYDGRDFVVSLSGTNDLEGVFCTPVAVVETVYRCR